MKFNVNGVQFAGDSVSPKTGFIGTTYNLWMNGTSTATNANYTYDVDKEWVSVDAAGKVTLTAELAVGNGTVSLTVTPTKGEAPITFVISLNKWFINGGTTRLTAAATDSYCASLDR